MRAFGRIAFSLLSVSISVGVAIGAPAPVSPNDRLDWNSQKVVADDGRSEDWLGRSVVSATSIDIDNDSFIGTITHWPPDLFEFQFNSSATGEVVILETKTIGSEHALDKYLLEELLPKLAASKKLIDRA